MSREDPKLAKRRDAYVREVASVGALLEEIQAAVREHVDRAKADDFHWGFIGDLTDIKGRLRDSLTGRGDYAKESSNG